ncbi:hypothetical protein [Solicola sp. PLA-1-18]|uniref:hypothetical protein n=1 Tax=Solicola sp. PLA-1-18 TaxID=3380532 RepID=UPI003B7C41B7
MTERPQGRRRRASRDVALSASFLLLAAGLAACGGSNEDYQAVCVNPDNQERVDDDYCDDDSNSGGYLGFVPVPYYFGSGFNGRYPGVGDRVSGGTTTVPAGATVGRGKVAKSGGTGAKAIRGGGFGGGFKASG